MCVKHKCSSGVVLATKLPTNAGSETTRANNKLNQYQIILKKKFESIEDVVSHQLSCTFDKQQQVHLPICPTFRFYVRRFFHTSSSASPFALSFLPFIPQLAHLLPVLLLLQLLLRLRRHASVEMAKLTFSSQKCTFFVLRKSHKALILTASTS